MFGLSCSPRRYAGVILDIFFPRTCVGCGRPGVLLCDNCINQLAPVGPACPKCGMPYTGNGLCAKCWSNQSFLDGIRAPYRFQGIIRTAIHQLKYHGVRSLAEPLARLLADYLVKNPIPGKLLVPVPLHPRRLRERGYNQSALLASHLGYLTDMPVYQDVLIRTKNTKPQARSDDAGLRRTNVEGAFTCRGNQFSGSNVILVDDVCTSGATLEACALAIKSAGASTVYGLVLAREMQDTTEPRTG